MKLNHLFVSEVFYSIQGEGPTMGYPAVFLRLTGCNLYCDGEWRCDTIEVWKKGKSTIFEEVLPDFCIKALEGGAHLVITGGEPLLQQSNLEEYIRWLRLTITNNFKIEIETNGTIIPSANLLCYVDYWNVSPKLSNSGEMFEKRCNPMALTYIAGTKFNYCFKFVISCKEDAIEVFNDFNMHHSKCIFMPAGATQEELDTTRLEVIELCKALNVRYCDRLHIVAWNKKTGV